MIRYAFLLMMLFFGALLALTRVAEPLDLEVLDLQFQPLRAVAPAPAAREVVVVGVRAASGWTRSSGRWRAGSRSNGMPD